MSNTREGRLAARITDIQIAHFEGMPRCVRERRIDESRMRIVLADDHELFRRGFRLALEERFGDAVFVECGSLPRVMSALAEGMSHLVSLDLDMPGMDGAASIVRLRQAYPELRIVVTSGEEDRSVMLEALGAGANGYIAKTMPTDDVLAAIERVVAGEIFLPATVARLSSTPPQKPAELPPRQRQVAEKLAQGLPTKAIAHELGMSDSTVKVHLSAIYKTWGVSSRYEAVLRAAELFPSVR
jgi:DNA-binding NarL/FixJ family response regulator